MTRRRHCGFTLIELLVVIGIIGALMAISVLAYRQITQASAKKLTDTRLELCQSMLAEYDQAASLGAIEGPGGILPALVSPSALPSIYVKSAGAAASAGCGNPGDVNFGSSTRTRFLSFSLVQQQSYPPPPISITSLVNNNSGDPDTDDWIWATAVQGTAMVFQNFSRVPSIQAKLAQLPGESFLQAGTGTGGPWINPDTQLPMPVILDGWKNPIIYVPSGGLHTVFLDGVTPTWPHPWKDWVPLQGVTDGSQPLGGGHWAIRRVRVSSIDGRPFFASAGPDGSFLTGDDNVYSVPVKYTDE